MRLNCFIELRVIISEGSKLRIVESNNMKLFKMVNPFSKTPATGSHFLRSFTYYYTITYYYNLNPQFKVSQDAYSREFRSREPTANSPRQDEGNVGL